MRLTTALPEHCQQQTQMDGWLTMDFLDTMLIELPKPMLPQNRKMYEQLLKGRV